MRIFSGNGMIRHLGLSNVTAHHLRRALEVGVTISWVQVEMHPLFCDFHLLQFCKEQSIGIQAWAPLARGRLKEDMMLDTLGKKHGKSVSQVAIRWILQHGCVPLPGSKSKEHMESNFKVNNFTLSLQEMQQIDERAKMGQRERVTEKLNLGFLDEFDFSYKECWPK